MKSQIIQPLKFRTITFHKKGTFNGNHSVVKVQKQLDNITIYLIKSCKTFRSAINFSSIHHTMAPVYYWAYNEHYLRSNCPFVLPVSKQLSSTACCCQRNNNVWDQLILIAERYPRRHVGDKPLIWTESEPTSNRKSCTLHKQIHECFTPIDTLQSKQ